MIKTSKGKAIERVKLYLQQLNEHIQHKTPVSLSKLMHACGTNHEIATAIKTRGLIKRVDGLPILLRQPATVFEWTQGGYIDNEQLDWYANLLMKECRAMAERYIKKREEKKELKKSGIKVSVKPEAKKHRFAMKTSTTTTYTMTETSSRLKAVPNNTATAIPFTLAVLLAIGAVQPHNGQQFDFTFKDVEFPNVTDLRFQINPKNEEILQIFVNQERLSAVLHVPVTKLYWIDFDYSNKYVPKLTFLTQV